MQFYNFVNKGEAEADLYITGDIVGDSEQWWYEWIEEDCAAPKAFKAELEKHKGKNLTVYIDSYGGDTVAASRIYSMLREHKGTKTVKIQSIVASAASVIAMAGDKVLMSPTAIMMIHNPWTSAVGNQNDLRAIANILDTISESIINAYERKTHLSREKIAKLMDSNNGEGAYMDCNEAIEYHFADGVIGEENALLDSTVLNSIKNARMAVYNKVSFKPGNKTIEPQREVVEETGKETVEKAVNKPTELEIKALEAEKEFLKLKRKMA